MSETKSQNVMKVDFMNDGRNGGKFRRAIMKLFKLWRRADLRAHWHHTPQRICGSPGVRHGVAWLSSMECHQKMKTESEE